MDHDAFYSALAAKDARFDGVFFVGVTSTGIYCRPVCTARTPRPENCRYFSSAEAAEKARFRPCLRCRPELAPGAAPVDDASRIGAAVARRIEEGLPEGDSGIETVAAEFELSSRQLRRIVQREFGVSPMELIMTRRLLLAKQLLTETTLPVTAVAFASGFSSLRRFHDAFGSRYGIPPTRLRREAREGADGAADVLELQLAYRPPYDWCALLDFLGARAIPGVEAVESGRYLRTVRIGEHAGWIAVRHRPASRALAVEIAPALVPALPALLGRVRRLFDLDARPDVIEAHLAQDRLLAPSVRRHPGLRVPGAFDGFELAVRAILGQQVSVRGASTLAGRLAEVLGDEIETPHAGLSRHSPTAVQVASAPSPVLASIGLPSARAAAIGALAEAVAGGRLSLDAGSAPDATARAMRQLPGIGPWTASYVAMRALSWPDAFPKEDLLVRRALGGVTPAAAEAAAAGWRPWRSYAAMHLWRMAAQAPGRRASAAGGVAAATPAGGLRTPPSPA